MRLGLRQAFSLFGEFIAVGRVTGREYLVGRRWSTFSECVRESDKHEGNLIRQIVERGYIGGWWQDLVKHEIGQRGSAINIDRCDVRKLGRWSLLQPVRPKSW